MKNEGCLAKKDTSHFCEYIFCLQMQREHIIDDCTHLVCFITPKNDGDMVEWSGHIMVKISHSAQGLCWNDSILC